MKALHLLLTLLLAACGGSPRGTQSTIPNDNAACPSLDRTGKHLLYSTHFEADLEVRLRTPVSVLAEQRIEETLYFVYRVPIDQRRFADREDVSSRLRSCEQEHACRRDVLAEVLLEDGELPQHYVDGCDGDDVECGDLFFSQIEPLYIMPLMANELLLGTATCRDASWTLGEVTDEIGSGEVVLSLQAFDLDADDHPELVIDWGGMNGVPSGVNLLPSRERCLTVYALDPQAPPRHAGTVMLSEAQEESSFSSTYMLRPPEILVSVRNFWERPEKWDLAQTPIQSGETVQRQYRWSEGRLQRCGTRLGDAQDHPAQRTVHAMPNASAEALFEASFFWLDIMERRDDWARVFDTEYGTSELWISLSGLAPEHALRVGCW